MIFELDAQMVVDAHKGGKLNNSEFRVIILDYKRLLEQNGIFEVRFIRR